MSVHRPIAKISASFANLSDAKLFYKANHICESIFVSHYYQTPKPGVMHLKEALTRFEKSLKVANIKTRINVFNKNEARKDLIGLLKELGHYVNYTARGNVDMLLSSGFDISHEEHTNHTPSLPVLEPVSAGLVSSQINSTVSSLGILVLVGFVLLG